MNYFQNVRFWAILGGLLVALLLGQQVWHWEVERIEVPPGKFVVQVHRWGTDLAEDEILAPNDSYKGVLLEVLPEGRHFLNPLFWGHEVQDMVQVPPGKCLVRMRKYGKPIPKERLAQGDILAGEDERGIVREVQPPGSYRLNPYAYNWQLVPAVEIGMDQVGVRTLKVGKDPRALRRDPQRGHYVVPDGYRGVQATAEKSGSYYLNPYVETMTPIEVRSHRVELSDIEFPSRDGFQLKPHVLVEYRVQSDKAPEMFVRLADEGVLHQADNSPAEQQHNEILQKVILPHIRGFARIEGSNFIARDFIVTAGGAEQRIANSREKLQQALLAKVRKSCTELGIDVLAVLLADLEPPQELREQISQREVARVTQDRNVSRLGQYKAEQELMAKEALKEQYKEKVEAETRLLQAQTHADQRRKVAELQMKQELESAQLRLDAARKQAEATLTTGRTEAGLIELQNEAEVAGLRKAVQGFTSAGQFAQYHVVLRLAPALKEIFASDTSDFAKLFADYLTPPPSLRGQPAAGKLTASPNPMSQVP